MSVLIVRQSNSNGFKKTWKIDSRSRIKTFGVSRNADLISNDPTHSAFDSAIEYRQDGWHFLSFNMQNSNPDVLISSKQTVRFENSTLELIVEEQKEVLLEKFEQIRKGDQAQNKKLYLVVKDDRLLKTQICEMNEKFFYTFFGKSYEFHLSPTTQWQEEAHEGFVIKSKLIKADSLEHLEKIPKEHILSSNDKKSITAVLGVTSLLVFGALIFAQQETLPVAPPTEGTKITFKVERKQRREIKKEEAAPVAQTKSTNPAPQESGHKGASLLKGAISARISQLIGKVSATQARTANIIVSNQGVKAGEGASGRALAAVGKIDASGHNWSGDSSGKGVGVSTNGVGGGHGTKGLGTGLGQGKTGTGGVGLIEEESEISGGLDREIIAQYIKTQLGQILYCYERQLSASPELYGKVAVKFTISGTGQVETQAINDSSLKNSSVEGCILNKIAKWKFPEPKGGTKVLVTYPFLFKSTN